MEFLGKVAVVTGGAHGIGKCVCEQFAKEGAAVRVIDVAPNDDFVGDIGDEATLCRFAAEVVRVNSISPGWIDVIGTDYSGADAVQQPVGRVGTPLDIAHMVLFLCSERAGFLTGENIRIDGGMTRQMIYHGEHGWSFDPRGTLL